jgi:hypothetical protein
MAMMLSYSVSQTAYQNSTRSVMPWNHNLLALYRRTSALTKTFRSILVAVNGQLRLRLEWQDRASCQRNYGWRNYGIDGDSALVGLYNASELWFHGIRDRVEFW